MSDVCEACGLRRATEHDRRHRFKMMPIVVMGLVHALDSGLYGDAATMLEGLALCWAPDDEVCRVVAGMDDVPDGQPTRQDVGGTGE